MPSQPTHERNGHDEFDDARAGAGNGQCAVRARGRSRGPSPAAARCWWRSRPARVNPLDTKIRAGAAAHAKHPLPGDPRHGSRRHGARRSARVSSAFGSATRSTDSTGGVGRAAGVAGGVRGGRCRPGRAQASQPLDARGRGVAADHDHRLGRPRRPRAHARRAEGAGARRRGRRRPRGGADWPWRWARTCSRPPRRAQFDTVRRFGATPIDYTSSATVAGLRRPNTPAASAST